MTWGEQNTEEEAWEQLDYAMSQGINFIDTGVHPLLLGGNPPGACTAMASALVKPTSSSCPAPVHLPLSFSLLDALP